MINFMKNLANLTLGSYLAIAGCSRTCNEQKAKVEYIKPGKYLTHAPELQGLTEKVEAKLSNENLGQSHFFPREYGFDTIIEITKEGKIFVYPMHLEEKENNKK